MSICAGNIKQPFRPCPDTVHAVTHNVAAAAASPVGGLHGSTANRHKSFYDSWFFTEEQH